MIKIDIKDEKLQRYLNEVVQKVRNPQPFFNGVGEIMISSIQKNFEVGGRPRWSELKQATLKAKRRKGRGSRILIGEGRLSRIGKKVTLNSVIVGPTDPRARKYAATHQFGRDFGRGSPIRARPFLVVQDQDKRAIIRLAKRYLSP